LKPTCTQVCVALSWGWLVRRWSVRRWGWALVVLCAVSQVGVATSSASRGTSLDPEFGKEGVVAAQVVPGVPSAATSIALQSDGDVLVGGRAGAGYTGNPIAGSWYDCSLTDASIPRLATPA
jgi:hypothetical protein